MKKILLSISLLVITSGATCFAASQTDTSYVDSPVDSVFTPEPTMLSGAVVTHRMKLVEVKMDKIVVNVRESAFAQGSNALDLMKKSPGVTIDKDGNVKLNGKSVSVWIDGRPSHADGKALEALLRSVGGDSIDKFELMEHPSAKYDAEGQGGIINIRTRRNFKQGISGTVGLGGGAMYFKDIDETPIDQSAWANLSYRTKWTNSFLNVREASSSMPIVIANDLTMPGADIFQKSSSTFTGGDRSFRVKFGTDWFIDDKNTLGAIVNVPWSTDVLHSKESWSDRYVGGALYSRSSAYISNGPSESLRHNANVNYTHVFDETKASEMTVNLDYIHTSDVSSSTQADTTRLVSDPVNIYLSSKGMESSQGIDIYSAKADYQGVIMQKYMVETGVKWALSKTDNNSLETLSAGPQAAQDFTYREHVAAAYASLAGQLGAKLSFKAGLRGEYTNSLGDWKSVGTSTSRSYFDLFPTFFLGYKACDDWMFNASYSRRINRPGYNSLNPTKLYIDSNTYTVGNPDILPQYNNDYSLSAVFKEHLSLALTYDFSYNLLNQIPTYGSNGEQYLTWGNYGKQRIGIATVSVSALPVGKWLQWTFNANGMYLNSVSNVSDLERNSLVLQTYTDLTFVLPKDWKVSLDGYYNSPMVFGPFETHQSWSSNLAVKKNLLENRLILTFKFDDIFRSSANNLDMFDELGSGSTTAIWQTYYMQKVSFNLSWSFGQSQKTLKHRNVGNADEVSRIGSGGGIGK